MITFLLFVGLFFPRIALTIAYLGGGVPTNNVPLFFDFIGTLIIPRILIMYYIWYAELGGGWMFLHIFALIIAKIRQSNSED